MLINLLKKKRNKFKKMGKIFIKDLGEHIPGTKSRIALNNIKEFVIVPAKFNANGEVGLLVNGFDKNPYFMEPYNAPYYREYFEKYGFQKENDWFSMNTDHLISNKYMSRIENLMEKINGTSRNEKLNEFNIRNINFKNLNSEIKIIKDLYNPIWGRGNHFDILNPLFKIGKIAMTWRVYGLNV
ncbi:MAG: hypothetical protein ACYDIA_10400 [Candidatus Humimicrobiaceae bacterium]